MRRLLTLLLLAFGPLLAGGCAMCCAPYDCDYLYQGGKWVRTNPSSGRVGSVFDPAGEPALAGATMDGGQMPMQLQPQVLPTPQTRSVIPRTMGESYLP